MNVASRITDFAVTRYRSITAVMAVFTVGLALLAILPSVWPERWRSLNPLQVDTDPENMLPVDEPVRVFHQVWDQPLMSINGRHPVSDLIVACGGENVFAGSAALVPLVSREAVLRAAPAVITAAASPDGSDPFAAWRRWPTHVILLVTDGDGSIPLALPGDKARTSAILIPPDCDPGAMSQIAARVVTLGDLRGLADVLALLTPRTS